MVALTTSRPPSSRLPAASWPLARAGAALAAAAAVILAGLRCPSLLPPSVSLWRAATSGAWAWLRAEFLALPDAGESFADAAANSTLGFQRIYVINLPR